MRFWQGKRVTVTGGGGFLGKPVVDLLKHRGCKKIFVPRSKEYDLRKLSAIKRMLKAAKPDIIIHLAAVVGGIGANRENPGKFFYDNSIMGIQLIEEARHYGLEKLVTIVLILSLLRFLLKSELCGMGILKRRTRLTVWPKKCFWFNRKLIVSSTVLILSIFFR